MRNRKRQTGVSLWVFVALALGCGTTPGPPADDDGRSDRLEVNDSLRAACPYDTDARIRSLILLTEDDRKSGWQKSDEIDDILLVCSQMVDASGCLTCGMAIIDQVYGD